MLYRKIKDEIKKVIVGQEEMIDALIAALLSEGHILLEGLPGLAKTTTVKTVAKSIGVAFKRIQFTPDLLPSDIIGTEIFNPKTNDFSIKKGPVFTNILLADEINRSPAKVQSALLEAMQERQVTIAEESFPLPSPFVVLATQNPIEHEGTYKLPEAQLDRFMMKITLDYPHPDEEIEILKRSETGFAADVQPVVSIEEIEEAKKTIAAVYAEEALKRYIVSIVFATRQHPDIRYGSSPRGGIELLKAAKVHAYFQNRDFITPEDILKMALPVLRHRIVLDYEALAKGLEADGILKEIIEKVPIP